MEADQNKTAVLPGKDSSCVRLSAFETPFVSKDEVREAHNAGRTTRSDLLRLLVCTKGGNTMKHNDTETAPHGCELAEARQRIAELEAAESEWKRVEEALRTRTHELDDRVKELHCLNKLARLTETRNRSIEEILRHIVNLIPPAWQYPDITCARIVAGSWRMTTDNFRETPWRQSAEVRVLGEKIGSVDVYYLEEMPRRDEGPFQRDERALLDTLASMVGEFIERRQTQDTLSTVTRQEELILNSVSNGILCLDLLARITLINPAAEATFGWDAREAIGKNFHNLLHVRPDGSPCSGDDCLLYEALMGGRPYDQDDETFGRKDGSPFPANCVVRPLEERGRTLGWVVSVRDITGRKRAEEQRRIHREKLQSLASQLVLAEERERRSLAEALHDRVGQSLALAKMKLGMLRESALSAGVAEGLDEIRELLSRVIRDSRSLTSELSHPVLYELGLEAAVEKLVAQFKKHYSLQVRLENDGRPKPLDEEMQILLFRAIRELLMNVVRHAQTSTAKLTISRNRDTVGIAVKDDGVGFHLSGLDLHASGTSRFGLFSIRERLISQGGSFQIESTPGLGTQVALSAPLTHQGACLKGERHEHKNSSGR